mmetsp:Transcript_40490/g.67243  ORF Transcript_40490/g.67243 Transcript_40490/m.67243 type:complete len:213 (+) Transcript_40490:590-1228(+)
MVPLCSATNARQSESPIPAPPYRSAPYALRLSVALMYRWKMSSWSSGLIPMPVSHTCSSSRSLSSCGGAPSAGPRVQRRRRTRPLCGVNLMALLSRFMMHWLSRCPSPTHSPAALTSASTSRQRSMFLAAADGLTRSTHLAHNPGSKMGERLSWIRPCSKHVTLSVSSRILLSSSPAWSACLTYRSMASGSLPASSASCSMPIIPLIGVRSS